MHEDTVSEESMTYIGSSVMFESNVRTRRYIRQNILTDLTILTVALTS